MKRQFLYLFLHVKKEQSYFFYAKFYTRFFCLYMFVRFSSLCQKTLLLLRSLCKSPSAYVYVLLLYLIFSWRVFFCLLYLFCSWWSRVLCCSLCTCVISHHRVMSSCNTVSVSASVRVLSLGEELHALGSILCYISVWCSSVVTVTKV